MNSLTVSCLCADATTHPEGDTVTFRAQVGFRELALAERSISFYRADNPEADAAEILTMISEFYLYHFIESWTLKDAKGKALEVTKANVRDHVITRPEVALELADFADGLYTASLVLPLVSRASSSSPVTSTAASTSAPQPTGTNGKRSKQSLTSTTPMAATVEMPT